jgi:hypothetical protein
MPIFELRIFKLPKDIDTEEDLIEQLQTLVGNLGKGILEEIRRLHHTHSLGQKIAYVSGIAIDLDELMRQISNWDYLTDKNKMECSTCGNQVRVILFQDESRYECDLGLDRNPYIPDSARPIGYTSFKDRVKPKGQPCPEYKARRQKKNGETARTIYEILKELEST